ncbi:MAG: imidazolonepropionase [Actinobacteria bacterium]|jgi:imidazolonepropionase|nr:imidazolonepropionase [Actinomycetota bacterium]MCO5300921.1 imidazolonepropionase [Candidatus Nanopelagicales bacterium]MCB9428575.1 imidazolonepropionase [Actinomycetota bacterium]HPE12441.1 imidazolonepropionase [Actinomycetota bacterium]HPQ84551.1 imidazolonepropionase [Actinomycetota bacterium]
MTASLLLDNIGELVTNDPGMPDPLGLRQDVAVIIDGDEVAWIGAGGQAPAVDARIDCAGAAVLPGFVDSHSHLVFAGDRSQEFAARMAGRPYAAGGINTTVQATRSADDQTLHANVSRLADQLRRSGITTFEIKSGYGLTVDDEARAVRLASAFTDEVTLLGAHVVPPEFSGDRRGYLDLVNGPMLDACAPTAKWVDVFCDRGAFDADESREVLAAGIRHGLVPRVHANQLQHGPGVAVAVAAAAASADHCTYLTDADIAALSDSATVATLLPGAEFSTRSPYPDARRLLDAGVTIALATDCNPGTSYTTSMPFCIALAVREMHMTVSEAVVAATLGGAAALRRSDVGRIVVGGPADLVLLDAPSHIHLAYRPGVDLVRQVWRRGRS